ncbi:tyrosine-protein phosphatase [Adhaeribacter pallidiroseus]|uniref:protein-tyrosine-phosphatase n=1 Tax=Adhaeribacter pallidiroseus TaxID=2072847 RepID=A0A369QNZ2_9BACT|nr:CpsB/CapC family capsule biosynthesis tyrosine phosphatase [Adhaeribacter pallidiroseus]RDC64996.1 Protein-tyrosine-phosphatase [Adhaeribacter pallidiroseus]
MASFFKRLFPGNTPAAEPVNFLKFIGSDMHAHVLPGLDDGAESLEQAMAMIRKMQQLGYHKLILTPHVMGDFYKNTDTDIKAKLAELQIAVQQEQIAITLECAAEYYLDEWFVEKLEAKQPLLCFGANYVLIETSYINEPMRFQDIIFQIKSNGYKPVLAHPERYSYLYNRWEHLVEWHEKEVLFQINLNSLTGYYGPEAKRIAKKLLDHKLIDFVGTDAHSEKQLRFLQKLPLSSVFKKLQELPLRNYSL